MNATATLLSLPVTAPALLRPWLTRAGISVWRSFEAAGRARAQRHLLDFASQCESQQPELAKELRAAAGQGVPS